MSEININVIDQSIDIIESPLVASGGVKENYVNFTFSEEWDGFTKSAIFYQDEDNAYYSVIDYTTNRALVPWEVTTKAGRVFIGVYGVKDDVVLTSQVRPYKVVKGAITTDLNPGEATPDIYSQFIEVMSAVGEMVTSAEDAVNAAVTAMNEARSITKKRFIQTFSISSSTSSVTFAPTDYVYTAGDRFEVYVNGLKLMDSEFSTSRATITFTTPIAGSAEVVEIICYKDINVADPTDEQVERSVDSWLDDHPEATTTVQDGSLTYKKLLNGTLGFVTPEMYGAKADGITDDSEALQTASEHGIVYCSDKTFYIGKSCNIQSDLIGGHFIINKECTITFSKPNGLIVSDCEFENDDYYPSTGRGKWMILINEAKNAIFSNCYIHKGVSAMYLNRCKNVIITGNIFYDLRQMGLSVGGNGYGILTVESKNIMIKNNEFLNVARHSIYISHDDNSSYNENIFIDSNIFKWDDGVVGNTSGFEMTCNIRPSKKVIISNNLFDNMFGVSGFVVQDIKIDGETVFSASENIVIKNNYGEFRNAPRYNDTGVVFFPSNSEHEVATDNVTIENNDFTIDKGIFVVGNAIKNIDIIGNKISYENYNTWNTLFYSVYSSEVAPIENVRFDRNIIKNAEALFVVGTYAKSFGDLIISNNQVDIDYIGSAASGSSFDRVIITNNNIKNIANRCYFSSAPVGELTIKNNTIKTKMSLYLSATSVLSTDPCFQGYGYNSSNPPGTMPGSIHTWLNGDIYMVDSTGAWRKISLGS